MIIVVTAGGKRSASGVLARLPEEPWTLVNAKNGQVLASGDNAGDYRTLLSRRKDTRLSGPEDKESAESEPTAAGSLRSLAPRIRRRSAAATTQLVSRLPERAHKLWAEAKAEATATRAKPVRGITPTRRELARTRALKLLSTHPEAAVIAIDAASTRLVWHLSRERPDQLMLAYPDVAVNVLELLRERDQPWTTQAARSLLDPQRLAPATSHDFPPRRIPGRPRVVSIVSNSVDGDSRVQKTAASLAHLGYESILLGRHPDDESDAYYYQGALVQRIRVPLTQTRWERESPPRTPGTALGYRSLSESRAAKAGARAHSRQIDADVARITSSGIGARSPQVKQLQMRDGAHRHIVAMRRALHRINREKFLKLDPENLADSSSGWHRPFLSDDRRSHFPRLLDLELGFGPTLERLKPDVVHVHDADMLSVATNAASRLAAAGWNCRVVYDAHEYTPGVARGHARQRSVLEAVERDCLSECDAVITVSAEIAELMQREHNLESRPAVVTNAPHRARAAAIGDVRTDLELAPGTPLLVYLGRLAPQRGVDLVVDALPQLPGTHLVVLTPENRAWRDLEKQAQARQVSERIHRLDYVAADDVTAYIATADIGLIPFRHLRNSELALPTKFREYLLGGVPMVASDFGAVAKEIQATGVGELFTSENVDQLAGAVSNVLADPAKYRDRLTEKLQDIHSWEAQESKLAKVYRNLGVPTPTPTTVVRADAGRSDAVLIGPANYAGQGHRWAASLRTAGVPATSYQMILPDHPFRFDSDITVVSEDWQDLEYRLAAFLDLVPKYSHILVDGRRPLFDLDNAQIRDLDSLARSGIRTGLIFHGSELRRPNRHAERESWSPFADPANASLSRRFMSTVNGTHRALADYEGPAFVSTPDLLDDLPWAHWLPVVVDTEAFAPTVDGSPERDIPVVIHAPSRAPLKGTQFIDPVLRRLDSEGVIHYRRLHHVPHDQMPELIRSADIVVDQVLMNLIGVGAAETMSTGVVCVAHLDERIAERFPHPPPVVDATPDTLERTIRELASDAARRADLGQLGRAFATEVHDGRLSARVLIDSLRLASRAG